jgi:hypothetical protein
MIRSGKGRNRRQRKKFRVGEFQDRAFPTDLAVATRALLFAFDDGRSEKIHVYVWVPHEVAAGHWRCPFLIQGESFEEGSYSAGADSMQALILATHSISSHIDFLARTNGGVFTCDGSSDLGFPHFGEKRRI